MKNFDNSLLVLKLFFQLKTKLETQFNLFVLNKVYKSVVSNRLNEIKYIVKNK